MIYSSHYEYGFAIVASQKTSKKISNPHYTPKQSLPTGRRVINAMKPNIHPPTHPVIFVDTSSGAEFVTTSTLSSENTRDIDGVKHFVINVEISSASHPFFTGEERFVDTAGRVDKFKEKLARVEDAAKERVGKKAKREAKIAEKKALEVKKPKKEKKVAPVAPAVEEPVVEVPTAEAPTETTAETPADTEK